MAAPAAPKAVMGTEIAAAELNPNRGLIMKLNFPLSKEVVLFPRRLHQYKFQLQKARWIAS